MVVLAVELAQEYVPEVFRMDDDGLAEVYVDEVPEEAKDSAIQAQEECPVSVITVEE